MTDSLLAPGRKEGMENYLTPDERYAVEAHVDTLGIRKWRPVDVKWAYRIAYYCALRMAEVPKLRARSFDWDVPQVYLGRTKTKANYAPVPRFAVAHLQTFWDERLRDVGDIELLPGCTTDRIYRWLHRAGRDLGIPCLATPQKTSGEKAVAHAFRKSMAKDMLSGKFGRPAQIGEVQAQLRHDNPVTTGRYLRLGAQAATDFWEGAGSKAAEAAGAAAGAPAAAEEEGDET